MDTSCWMSKLGVHLFRANAGRKGFPTSTSFEREAERKLTLKDNEQRHPRQKEQELELPKT